MIESVLGKSVAANLSTGGTVDGDLTVTGSLGVGGDASINLTSVVSNSTIIDATGTEAFLVRKESDAGDIFTVNTANSRVNVGTPTGTGIFEVEGSVDNDWAGRFENKHSGGYGGLFKVAGTTSGELVLQARAGSDNILTILGDGSSTFSGDVNISKAGNATLNIKNSSDGLSDEGEIGTIEFEGDDESTNRAGVMAKIVARYSDTGSGDAIDGSANEGGSLGFFTSIATSIGGSQTLAEKMRIENNGNVGIGTSSPTSPASVGKFLNIADSGSAGIVLEDTNAGDWEMYNASGVLYFEDRGNTALALTLKNDKSAIFGGNIRVGSDLTSITSDTHLAIGDSGDTHLILGEDANNHARITWDASEDALDFNLKDGGTGTVPLILTGTAATFSQPVDGDAYISLDNVTGGSSSVNETAALRLQLGDGSTLRGGAKITVKKEADYSTGANMDASLMFSVLQNNAYNDAMHLKSSGKLGLGISEPDTNLHILEASAGSITATSEAQLTIENSGLAGINILSGNSSHGIIHFGDDGGNQKGRVGYDHSADAFYVKVAGVNTKRFIIDTNSRISLSNNDSGTSNTVLGYGSGANIDAGSNENVFIGHQVSGNGTNNDSLYNVGIGFQSLFDLAGGDGNTAIGHKSLFELDEGQFNVSIGKGSLQNLTSGSSNVAIGTDALGSPTTAEDIVAIGRGTAYAVNSDNADGTVAIGRLALQALTSGAGNTSVGYQSSQAVNIGRYNTAFGHQALYSEDVGDRSTAVGWGALYSQNSDTNNEVTGNTGIGMQSGYSNVTGTYNTYVGYNSGYGGGSSSQNVAVGANSLIAINGGDNNVAVGYGSAIALTSGGSNVAIGHSSMATATTASENVAIGYEALGDIDTGSGANVAIGYYAMRNVDEGTGGGDADYNIAIGYDALKGGDFASNDRALQGNIAIGMQAMNSTADNAQTGTIAVGHQSLKALTSGTSNTAIGYFSMGTNTNSSNNTAFGYYTLGNMDGGNGANTAVGNLAMLANTTGATNTAVGDNASRLNQTGVDNVAVGRMALYSNTTSYNTAVGLEAMYSTTSGGANTAVGFQSLHGDTDGDGADNTAIGHKALHDAISPSKNVAIGDSAMRVMNGTANGIADCVAVGANAFYGDATNTTTGANGTVAIGKDALKILTTGGGNTAVGFQALDGITTSAQNTAVGYSALTACGDSYANTAVGYQAGDTISNSGAFNVCIGTDADVSTGAAENQIVIGRATTGVANNSVTLGNSAVTAVYMASDSGATVHCAGVNFPDTFSDNADVNVLDDYEEGDWTPVITDGSNDATMNSTFNQGKYTKIGRLVTVSFNCLTSSLGSVSGSISIKGFPFTVGNNYGSGGAGASAGFGNGLAITAGTTVTVSMNLNATTANLQHFDVSTGISALQHSEWTDDGNLKMSLSYMT